jgi:hypothetical protein
VLARAEQQDGGHIVAPADARTAEARRRPAGGCAHEGRG